MASQLVLNKITKSKLSKTSIELELSELFTPFEQKLNAVKARKITTDKKNELKMCLQNICKQFDDYKNTVNNIIEEQNKSIEKLNVSQTKSYADV